MASLAAEVAQVRAFLAAEMAHIRAYLAAIEVKLDRKVDELAGNQKQVDTSLATIKTGLQRFCMHYFTTHSEQIAEEGLGMDEETED